MAQYASATDLAAVGLPAAALLGISVAQQTQFLSEAGDLIDSFLRAQYQLPIAGGLGPPNTFPGELTRCNITIACYELLVFRGFNPDEYDTNWRQKWEDCMAWLKMLASGEVSISPLDDATPTVNEGAPAVRSNGNPRAFAGIEPNVTRGW